MTITTSTAGVEFSECVLHTVFCDDDRSGRLFGGRANAPSYCRSFYLLQVSTSFLF